MYCPGSRLLSFSGRLPSRPSILRGTPWAAGRPKWPVADATATGCLAQKSGYARCATHLVQGVPNGRNIQCHPPTDLGCGLSRGALRRRTSLNASRASMSCCSLFLFHEWHDIAEILSVSRALHIPALRMSCWALPLVCIGYNQSLLGA